MSASNDTFPPGFSPSNLVKNFHRFPHYNFAFHSVDSAFAPDQRDYLEALIELALPLSIIATLFFLYFIIRACCCRTGDFDPFKPSEARHSRVILFILLFLSLGTLALTIVGSVHASSAVSSFTDATSATQALIDQLSAQAQDLGQDALALASSLNNITVPPEQQQAKTGIVSKLNAMAGEVDNVVDRIKTTVQVAQWNDDVHNGDKARGIASLSFSSAMIALVCLALLAMACRSFGLLRLCYGFLVLAFLVCWVACSAELSLAVGTADFCTDPNTYISSEIDDNVASYYILCDGKEAFPLQAYFVRANDDLVAAAVYAANLSSTPGVNASVVVEGLRAEVGALSAALDCRAGLHSTYQECVDVVCDKGMWAMATLLFSHGFTGLLILFSLFAIQRVARSYHTRFAYVVNMSTGDSYPNERTQLLDGKSILL